MMNSKQTDKRTDKWIESHHQKSRSYLHRGNCKRKKAQVLFVLGLISLNGAVCSQALEDDEQEIEQPAAHEHYEQDDARKQKSHGGRHGPPPVSRLLDDLDVEAEQRDSVREILRAERDQMYALRADIQDQADAKRSLVQSETRERLSTVLSAEQLGKYDQIKARQRAHRRH